MSDIRKLPVIQREILKRVIMLQPQRPEAFSFNRIYKQMSYKKYTEEQAFSGFKALIEAGVFEEKDDNKYIFIRERYFEVRSYYRFSAFFSDANSSHVMGIFSIGVAVAGLALVSISSFIDDSSSKTNTTQDKPVLIKDEVLVLENRLEAIEGRLEKILNLPDDKKSSVEIAELRDKFVVLNESTNTLMNLITKDPSKLVELSLLRAEIEKVRERQNERYFSLGREIDKISSYNTTIIAFMITFLVGLLGFGVFNYLRDKPSSNNNT